MTDRALNIFEAHQPIYTLAAVKDTVYFETDGAIHAFAAGEVHSGRIAPTAKTCVLTLDGDAWTLDARGRIVALGEERLRRAGIGAVHERPVRLPGPADAVAAAPQGEALLAVCGVAINNDIEVARMVEIGHDGAVRTLDLDGFGQIEVRPFSRGYAALVCDTGRVWYVTDGSIGHLNLKAEDAHSLRPALASGSLALIRADAEGRERIALGIADSGVWLWRDLPMPAEIEIADFAWRGAHPDLVLSATLGGRGHLMVAALDGTVLTMTALPTPWVTDKIAVAPDGLHVYAICGTLMAVWKVALQSRTTVMRSPLRPLRA